MASLPRFTFFAVVVIVVSLLLSQSNAKLVFESPFELQGLSVNAYQFMFVGDRNKLNVSSARVVASDPLHACHWNDIKNKDAFENNLVIVGKESAPGRACSPATKFRNVEKGKGIGIIILERRDEYAALSASYFLDAGGINIGGVEAQSTQPDNEAYDLILKYTKNANQTVIATVQADDTELESAYYIAFSVIIGLFALMNVYFAVIKLRQFVIENDGFRASLPQVCLSLEIAANILRVVLCLEPDVDIGRGIIDFGTINFLQSGSLPWSFTSTLMIAFYWDQSLRAFGEKHTTSYNVFSLERWKIPMIGACVLMVIGDLARCTVLALYMGSRDIAIVIFVFFGICALGIGAYFTYSGIKVLEWAKHSSSKSSKKDTLARMTQFVVANAVGLFWIVACLVIMSASTIGWFYGYIPLFFGLNFVSLVQINMFQPSAHFGSSTSGGKTTSGGLSSKTLNLQDNWATSSSKFAENSTEGTTTTDATSASSAVEMV